MHSVVTNLGLIAASKAASLAWLGLVSLLSVRVEGQALYKLDLNEKAGEGIYVVSFQVYKLDHNHKQCISRVRLDYLKGAVS